MIARLSLAFGVLVFAARVGGAHAQETFDYTVERFEVDGNVHGALDGTADLVDDFGDGIMGPVFQPLVGSAAESGGALHVQSPGLELAVLGVTPVRYDVSAVIDAAGTIALGGGDAALRIVLPPRLPGPNDAINFFLSWSDADGAYYGGLSFANLNRTLGDSFDPAIPPGASMFAHLEKVSYPQSEIVSLEPRSIDPLAITGGVVLELRYDDGARTITSRYSLDGGATFAPAFAPLPIDPQAASVSVYVAGAAYKGDCPAALSVRSARFSGLGRPGQARAKLRLQTPQWLAHEAMRIVLRDQGAGGAVLLDTQLPDAQLDTPRCDPRDGWSASGSRKRRYRNYSNALPPACTPGSAQGLQDYQSRWYGTADVMLKLKDGSLPAIVGPLRVELYHGTGPANACDGLVGDVPCVARPGAALCTP